MDPTLTVVVCLRTSDLSRHGDGTCHVVWPRGSDTVLSMQPDGTLQTRPSDAVGAWETARIVSDGLVFDDAAYPHAYFVPVRG